jgi:AcrR family transcriptional regulator
MDDGMWTDPTRQRLMDAATAAFLAQGYEAARLDLIAREAGISKKTIYKYAQSKFELFSLAVAEHIGRVVVPELRLDLQSDEDPKAALRRFLIAIAAAALSPEGLAVHCLIAREGLDFPELVEAHDRPVMPLVENLAVWLAAQTYRGWLAVASPDRAALMLFDMVLGADRRAAQFGAPAPDAAAQARRVDEALELFLYGAVARPKA